MKTFFTVLILTASFGVVANPEISNFGPVHVVINPNDSNDEIKMNSAQCESSVHPYGDDNTLAQGHVKCTAHYHQLPWQHVAEFRDKMRIFVSNPNFQCQLYGADNNAGDNQGYNVTQYNTVRWRGVHTAEEQEQFDLDGDGFPDYPLLPYTVVFEQLCILARQQ